MNKIEIIENITCIKLGPKTISYLENKDKLFRNEFKEMDKVCDSYWGFQAAHIVQLPYKIVALALQTISDLAVFTLSALSTIFTIGLCDDAIQSLKVRAFNLFVADLAAWASIPVSLFWCPLYKGANSIHLGTMREIDCTNLNMINRV